ncbi:MAG TPA: hypothetical protein VGN26_15605 [Armatimonadota bacterium]
MNLRDFRQAVLDQFGPNLEHATPANVREFLDQLQLGDYKASPKKRIVIDEPQRTYESIIKDFFARLLTLPPEESMVLLWTVALDLSFAIIESHDAELLSSLFPVAE